MAVLKKRGKFRTYKVMWDGDEVTFNFRHPTNPELNEFLASRVQFQGPEPVDASHPARLKFFEQLFDSVDNLTMEDGEPVTVEMLLAEETDIEIDTLSNMILALFETPKFEVLEKN